MTTVPDTLIDVLADDFARVCVELEHARLVQQLKDTTVHRAAVSDCQASVDAVLDMLLLVRRPTRARPAALT